MAAANHKTTLSPHGRFSLQLDIIFYYFRSIANLEARPRSNPLIKWRICPNDETPRSVN
jgi:hypothetical protein